MKNKNKKSEPHQQDIIEDNDEQQSKKNSSQDPAFIPKCTADQFRWMYRLKEPKTPEVLGIRQIRELMMSIISEMYSDEDDCEDVVESVMKGYNLDLYEEGNMLVTEEEFVYDSMRNLKLLNVLCSYNEMREAEICKL